MVFKVLQCNFALCWTWRDPIWSHGNVGYIFFIVRENTAPLKQRERKKHLSVWIQDERLHPNSIKTPKQSYFCNHWLPPWCPEIIRLSVRSTWSLALYSEKRLHRYSVGIKKKKTVTQEKKRQWSTRIEKRKLRSAIDCSLLFCTTCFKPGGWREPGNIRRQSR